MSAPSSTRTRMIPVHGQVTTSRDILVDAGMAPLLESLWSLGLETQFSCECSVDHCASHDTENGDVQVLFGSLDHATRFLGMLCLALELSDFPLHGARLTPLSPWRGPDVRGDVRFPCTALPAVTRYFAYFAAQ